MRDLKHERNKHAGLSGTTLSTARRRDDSSIFVRIADHSSLAGENEAVGRRKVSSAETIGIYRDMVSAAISAVNSGEKLPITPRKGGRCCGGR